MLYFSSEPIQIYIVELLAMKSAGFHCIMKSGGFPNELRTHGPIFFLGKSQYEARKSHGIELICFIISKYNNIKLRRNYEHLNSSSFSYTLNWLMDLKRDPLCR